MFVSPCSLRSAQCAALIALAAAAGLARTGPETTSRISTAPSETNVPVASRLTLDLGSDRVDPAHFNLCPRSSYRDAFARPSPWLQPLSTVALWFLCGTESASDLTAATKAPTSSGPSGVDALAGAAVADLPLAPTLATAPAFPRFSDRPALCTLSHLMPFAVGPPAFGTQNNRRVAGTSVPSDLASLRSLLFACFRSVRSVSLPFFSVARLACPSLSAPRPADASHRPSSALRGKPVLSALRHPTPLRASGPRLPSALPAPFQPRFP